MRTQNDYIIDKIRSHSQSHQEKPTEVYFTVTSTPAFGENELQGTFFPSTQGPSCHTYEIVMVSLCGSIFLLAVVVIALKTIRKRVFHVQSQGKSSSLSKEPAAETVVANIVARNDGDQIFTAQVNGPAYIRYVSETEAPPVTVLVHEEKPDSDTKLSFSFTSSISPLDQSRKQ